MAQRRHLPAKSILSAATAVEAGTAITVSDWQFVQLQFSTASSANLTMKIQGSLSEIKPDFDATQTAANHWDHVASYDLNDPSSIVVGSTGYGLTGTDTVQNLIVNVDGLNYINCELTARAAGNATVNAVCFNNQ